MKRLILFLYFLILLILFSGTFGNVLSSDSSFYAKLTDQIINEGKIQKYHYGIPIGGGDYLPIYYPQTFFLFNALFKLIIGDHYFVVLPFILFLVIFLLFYNIDRNYYSLFFITLIIANPSFLSIYLFRYKIEVLLFFFASFTFYFFIKFLKQRSRTSFFFTFLFAFLAFSCKQFGVLFLFFPIFLVILNFKKECLNKKNIFLISFLFLLIVLPVYLFQFSYSGTVLYPGISIPVISHLEVKLSNFLNINRHSVSDYWKDHFSSLEIVKARRDINIEDFTDKFSIMEISSFLVLFFILFGFLKSNKGLRNIYLSCIAFILLNFILYFFLVNVWYYFVFSEILIIFLFSLSLFRFNFKRYKVLALSLIIILSFIFISSNIQSALIARSNIEDIFLSFNEWVTENNLKDSKFFGTRAYEISYYAGNEVYWLHSVGNEDIYNAFKSRNISDFLSRLNAENISYLIFPHYSISKRDNLWTGNIFSGDVDFYENHPCFKKVYSEGITVLEVDFSEECIQK